MPFGLKQEASTMKRYGEYGQRYLCYCARMWSLGRDAAMSEHGARFSDKQWAALDGMVRQLDIAVQEEEDDDGNAAGVKEPAGEGGGDRRTALDEAVFCFLVRSIKQKLGQQRYRNPLLHFTAVLANDSSGEKYIPSHSFTRFLAGLLWCGRLVMLEHFFEGVPYEAGYDSDAEGEDVVFAAIQRFEEGHRTWLADGSYTPFSAIIQWMSYGRGYRDQEGGTARLVWESDGKTLSYQGQRVHVGEFQRAAQACVRNVEGLLDRLMGGHWAEVREKIRLRDIVDSLVFEGPGRSFTSHPQNGWLEPGGGLMTRLVGGTLWKPVTQADGSTHIQCRREAIGAFLTLLKQFRGEFMPTVHIWGGQPGRGPELATLKHCDIEQLPKNVFVFDGRVMLVTDRDKCKGFQERGRKVARFLPEDVSRIMVAYIAWLLPFERVVHRLSGIRGPSDSLGPWLWKSAEKGMWATDELSRRLGLLTGTHLGVRLTVASYRHVAIEFGRRIKGLLIRQREVEVGDDDEVEDMIDPGTGERRSRRRTEHIWDLQATHGSNIARRHYGLTVLFPNQLQPEMVSNYQEISRLWHEFLSRTDGEFGRKRTLYEVEEALASKRHCFEVRGGKTEASRQGGQGLMPRGAERSDTACTRGEDGLDEALRRLLGQGARWRSEQQREGMRRIMGMYQQGMRSEVCIVILPTGGGKSIFFMLPSLIEDDGHWVSVVVVPFIALAEDLVSRAQEFGIDCIRWGDSVPSQQTERQRDARLVVVSADVACTDGFAAYVESIRVRGLLRRIFFDECHTAVMDVGFRERLGLLVGLHRYGCPLVMLTATLPVPLESWFRRQMLAGDAVLLRAPIAKLNIRYQVRKVSSTGKCAVEDGVLQAMGEIEARMGPEHKGVVYCRSIRECEAMAERAGCGYYHSTMASNARVAALEEWVQQRSERRWIMATSGLGTGIDIQGIVGVVHMRQPYGLVDFVQQTGRGGRRKGETVDSIIVTDGRAVWHDEFGSDVDHINRQAIQSFMQAEGCRRIVLGQFLDGHGSTCESLGAERCDRCSRTGRASGAGKAAVRGGDGTTRPGGACERGGGEIMVDGEGRMDRLKEHVQQESRRLRMLERWLDEVLRVPCCVCYVKWHMHGCKEEYRKRFAHGRQVCKVISQAAFDKWQRGLQFADFQCCWECGLSYDWCRERRVDGRCMYRNRILPVVMMAGESGSVGQIVRGSLGTVEMEEKEYQQWVGRLRGMYGKKWTNGLAVWDEVVQYIYKTI